MVREGTRSWRSIAGVTGEWKSVALHQSIRLGNSKY